MANPDPAGKSIHQSIPPRRLPPIQRQFVRKTSNPRTFGALKFMARYLRVGPKQKTRRHAFSNQNTAGPSQKRRYVFPTKTQASQAKRRPLSRFVKCPFFRAHRRKVSATSRIANRRKISATSKPAKSRSDRPGFEEKPYGRRLADLGDLYQAARVPWSVRALPG